MQSHLQSINKLFEDASLHIFGQELMFYRGCWQADEGFAGGMWFANSLDNAAEYIAFHVEAGRKFGLIPMLLAARPITSLVLAEFSRNHMSALWNAYGGCFQHERLATDIPVSLSSLNRGVIHGFFRPGRDEYFISPVQSALLLEKVISGDAALREASRVKGFEV